MGTHSAQAILYGCEPDCSQGYSVIGDVYIDSANVTYEVRGPATPMQISACLYDQFWVAYACGVRFFSPGQFISGSLPLSGNSSPRIMFLFINVDGHSGTNNILFDYSVSTKPMPAQPINGVCSNPQVHYNCAPGGGTSVNNVAGASFWTWTCNGSGGGTNASCSEAVPPPLPTTGTVCVSSNTNDAYSVSGPESWSWNASGTTCFPNHSTGTYSASSSVGGSVSPSSATLTNGGTITFTITVGAPPPPPPPPPPTGYCYDPTATNYGLTLPCTYPDPTSVCQDKNATNYLRPLPCTYAPQAGVTLSWSLTGDTPWTRGNVTVVQGTRVYLELIGTNIPSNACVADWVGLVPYVYYSSVFPTQPSTLYTAYCQGDSGAYVYDYVTVKTVPPCAANTGASCTSSANACGQTNPGTIQCNGSCSATTPANPAGYGNACTSIANSCGQTNGGTIQCNGSCSATTPSNPPGYGVACTSSANACGQTQSNGTIQCNGSCSSTPPANPVGYGNVCTSSANSCGQTNTGTIQCNGTCSATTPANPAGYGSACTSSANACGQTNPGTILCNGSCSGITPSNSSCPVPTVTISANPNPVNYNTASTVTWSSTNTTSTCTVNGASYPTPGSDTTGPLANNTTYTIICQGLNGSQVTNSVTVSVNGPTVTISTNPTSVAYGGSSTISWSSSNASSCTKSGDWSGSTPPNVAGTQSTGALTPSPLGRTYTYTLTCSGANGSSNTQSATVTVSAPPAPTVTISANPNPVDYNTASTVTWSSTNTTSCTINGVGYPTSGSDTTGPLTNNATYTLTCQALDGSTKSASVTVSVNGPTVIISTNPTSVAYGGSSTISWSSSNASSCTKSGDWSGSTPPNVAGTQSTGVLVSGPLSQSKTYTYTLTCNGANGSSNSQSATVTVSPPPGPTLTISAAPNPVNYNTASTVTWSSTNTTSCTINGVGYPTSGSDTTGPLTNNATYNFLCTGPTGLTVSKSITVTVNSVSVTISTSPTSVNYNGSSTISWTVSSAGSCDASGDWGGHPDSSTGTHSQSTGALTSNKTYTIKCFGANGTSSGPVSASVSVNAPTVSISTSPTSVVYGGSSTISWSSSSVGSCTKSGDWSGSTPPNVAGNQSTGALNQVKTYTYTLMCSGNGSATQSATVNVSAPPPTTSNVSITEPDYCASGPAVTMSWAYSDPAGSPQSAYQVQLDDSGSFNSINVDSGKTMSSSNAWFSGQGVLSFNTVYHVRVRTWSGYDVVSPWQDASSCSGPGCTGGGSNSWKTPQYAYPQVDFTWTANSILNNPSPPMNKPVQFNDATVFNGNPNGRQWGWVFGDGGSSSTQNPAHTYTAEGTYYITLTATDNANQTCVRTKGPIIIQKPIPKWREIAPR